MNPRWMAGAPGIAAFFAAMIFAARAGAAGLGSWSKRAPMPDERSEVVVAALNGKIYVAGGFGDSGALLEYHPGANLWRKLPPPPRSVHHAGAAVLGERLYIVGGYRGGWDPAAYLQEYNPETGKWRMRAPLPTARGAPAAAAVNGKIYAISGTGPYRVNTGVHEVYDPAADAWSKRAPLPTPRDHLAAAAVGGKIYVLGGRIDGNYGQNLAANEVYDPNTDRWRAFPPLPKARRNRRSGSRRDHLSLRGRILLDHLSARGRVRSGFGQVEPARAHAHRAARTWGGGARRKNLCDLGGADAGRLRVGGQRGVHALAKVTSPEAADPRKGSSGVPAVREAPTAHPGTRPSG